MIAASVLLWKYLLTAGRTAQALQIINRAVPVLGICRLPIENVRCEVCDLESCNEAIKIGVRDSNPRHLTSWSSGCRV